MGGSTPRGTYRADLRTAVVVGLIVSLAAGLKFEPAFGFEANVVLRLGAGLGIGLLVAQVPLLRLTELVCQRGWQCPWTGPVFHISCSGPASRAAAPADTAALVAGLRSL